MERERIQDLKSNLIFIPFVSNIALRLCGYGFLVSEDIHSTIATYDYVRKVPLPSTSKIYQRVRKLYRILLEREKERGRERKRARRESLG
jgi:hypothetical protein